MSSEKLLAEITKKYQDTYQKRTQKSREAQEVAKKYLPGGDTRTAAWFEPYPIWVDKAEGCRFTDLDGNKYIDFHNNATALFLGHANPRVVAAVRAQAAKGSAFASPVPVVIRWAELIGNMVESVEKVRFGNIGSEAVMMAIRLARAATGKEMILKMEGCYHGLYDPVFFPSNSPGIARSALGDSIVVPYNDKEAAERAIVENKDKLAAVIVEGILGSGGNIPAREGYLEFLRKVTKENGVLLILDEVQSLRLAWGGVQKICGIKPDITTMGKFIGGGYPVGAFGGREDLMQFFNPEKLKIWHSATFNGNPITAVAGVATLEQLNPGVINRVNKLGESFAHGVRAVFQKLNIKGQVTGMGTLYNLHFSDRPVIDGKSAQEANKKLLYLFYLGLLERGIFSAARGMYNMSTPMTQREIDTLVKAVEDVLSELKPAIENLWPELIGQVSVVV